MINLLKIFTSKRSNFDLDKFINKLTRIYSKREFNLEIYSYNTIDKNSLLNNFRPHKIEPIIINDLYFFYLVCNRSNKNIILVPTMSITDMALDQFCSSYTGILKRIGIGYSDKRNILTNIYYTLNVGANSELYEDLMAKYNLVIVEKNSITIHDVIKCDMYKSKQGRIRNTPLNLQTTVSEVQFTMNSEGLLVEVKAITNKKIHPNINYHTNKYCTGNYIHMPISSQLIHGVISSMKIYNLNSYYKLDPSLEVLLNATPD